MQLSKEYIVNRLKNTSVQDLAKELAEATAVPGTDMPATITKFEKMLKPLAPKTTEVNAMDFMRANGVHVVEA